MMGFAGLVSSLVLGFEEPHTPVSVGFGMLVAAAPFGVALHLASTHELTRQEKRLWVSGLLSHKGPTLLSAYFNMADRHRMTHALCNASPIIESKTEA
jgi:hypothetical protein